VLGDVVGEHIVVLPGAPGEDAVDAWLATRALAPARVLGQRHVALDAAGLAAFVGAFPDLRYEVRAPTLDDLFLALSGGGTP
jgi:hypothetical protein